MATWRAFYGTWSDPEWLTFVDERGLTWEQARQRLLSELAKWREDDCDYCRAHAAGIESELRVLAPDTPWEDEVEGDDLVLISD